MDDWAGKLGLAVLILMVAVALVSKTGYFERKENERTGYDPSKNYNYKSSKEDIWPESKCDEIWDYSECIDNGCWWENTGDGDGFCMPSGVFN